MRELDFDDAVSHTATKWIAAQLDVYGSDRIRTPDTRVTHTVPLPTELSRHHPPPLLINFENKIVVPDSA